MLMRYWRKLLAAVLERLALNAFVGSDFDRAARLFDRIARLQPQRRGVEYNLGLCHLALGRHEEAHAALLRERERHGDSPPLSRSLADLALVRGRREEAADWYRQVHDTAPDEKQRRFAANRLRLCTDAGLFAAALRSSGENARGHELLAAGRFAEAEEAFRGALEDDPDNFLALNNLGVVAMNARRDYPEAAEWFRRAEALADLPVIRNNQRKLRQLMGEK